MSDTKRKLIIRQNNQLVKQISLIKRHISIGRDKFCDIILRDKTVSKRHAMILNDADTSYIEDMNSTNTTQVNSREIRQHKLEDNDVISIGRFQLHFQQESIEAVKNEQRATT